MIKKVVFTNGCFDIIHPGHIDLLERASKLGTKLIVGINSDASVRLIKGAPRPFLPQTARAEILKSLRFVDEVQIFDDPTPEKLIQKIKPDVLVKGGDWKTAEIIGADFVEKNGGRVFSLPLKDGFSSSAIVDKIRADTENKKSATVEKKNGLIEQSLIQHIEIFQKIRASQMNLLESCAEMLIEALESGNKILICGNGGSAADAQHIAAEFVGRYETERRALPAIALTTDTSALTAISNDYGFEQVFARQVKALAKAGDVLIALSTSGNSPNVTAAVMAARQIGCKTIGLTGSEGKKLSSLCDACVLVPAKRTARVQEAHITIGHIWCEMIDANFHAL